MSSDTTEYEVPEQLGVSRTRARGRHKGKQKGQVIGKKSLRSPRGPAPPTQSRSSPGSSNSEEITYSFDEGRDPRASSPSEGYLSYPCDSAADSETYGPYAFSRRNGEFSLSSLSTLSRSYLENVIIFRVVFCTVNSSLVYTIEIHHLMQTYVVTSKHCENATIFSVSFYVM